MTDEQNPPASDEGALPLAPTVTSAPAAPAEYVATQPQLATEPAEEAAPERTFGPDNPYPDDQAFRPDTVYFPDSGMSRILRPDESIPDGGVVVPGSVGSEQVATPASSVGTVPLVPVTPSVPAVPQVPASPEAPASSETPATPEVPAESSSTPNPINGSSTPGGIGAPGDGTRTVAFDKAEYDGLRGVVDEVAETTNNALWDGNGYSIGSELRAQPAAASWSIASQVGSSFNRLATQVRTETDKLCGKAMPDFSISIEKAAKNFEETDDIATADSQSS